MRITLISTFLGSLALIGSAATSAQVVNQVFPPMGGKQVHILNNQPFPIRCSILEWNGVTSNWVWGDLAPGITIWKWVHPTNPVQWNCVPVS